MRVVSLPENRASSAAHLIPSSSPSLSPPLLFINFAACAFSVAATISHDETTDKWRIVENGEQVRGISLNAYDTEAGTAEPNNVMFYV